MRGEGTKITHNGHLQKRVQTNEGNGASSAPPRLGPRASTHTPHIPPSVPMPFNDRALCFELKSSQATSVCRTSPSQRKTQGSVQTIVMAAASLQCSGIILEHAHSFEFSELIIPPVCPSRAKVFVVAAGFRNASWDSLNVGFMEKPSLLWASASSLDHRTEAERM